MLLVMVVAAACGGGKKGTSKPGGDDPIAKCEGGDGKACGELGDKYLRSDAPNAPLGATYLKKGCDLKYWRSCSDLAHLYHIGEGVPRDAAKGNTLYDLACDHDHGGSCFSRALEHNRFLKDCEPIFHDMSSFKKPPECTGKRQLAEGKRAIEKLRKGCRLKDEEACKIITAYDKGETRHRLDDDDLIEKYWMLPPADATVCNYEECE
jgi:TPR repeat protein